MSSSLASCSSSTTTAFRGIPWIATVCGSPSTVRRLPLSARNGVSCSCRNPLGRDHIWNLQPDNRAEVRHARDSDPIRRAVNDAEPLIYIAEADAVGQRRTEPIVGHAHPVVFDFDNRVVVLA